MLSVSLASFGGAADDVGRRRDHGALELGVEVRAEAPGRGTRGVPLRRRIRGCGHVVADACEVVVVAGVGDAFAQRQHRAAVEVEHQPVVLIDGGHPQRRQPGRRAPRLGRVLFESQRLPSWCGSCRPSTGKRWNHKPAVEQIRLDPLGDERRLPDGDVAHQRRMCERRGRARHRAAEFGVQRQPHPVAEDRLVHRRRAAPSASWPAPRRRPGRPAVRRNGGRRAYGRTKSQGHMLAVLGSACQYGRTLCDSTTKNSCWSRRCAPSSTAT